MALIACPSSMLPQSCLPSKVVTSQRQAGLRRQPVAQEGTRISLPASVKRSSMSRSDIASPSPYNSRLSVRNAAGRGLAVRALQHGPCRRLHCSTAM